MNLTTAVLYKSPVRVCGKVVLIKPLSLSDVLTFEHLYSRGFQERGVKYLLECAIQVGCDFDSKKKAVRFVCKKKGSLDKIVNRVCDISLPDSSGSDGDGESGRDVDFTKQVCRLLAKMYGWTSEQVSRMSPRQIHIYLTAGKSGTGVEKMSPAEYRQFREIRGMDV